MTFCDGDRAAHDRMLSDREGRAELERVELLRQLAWVARHYIAPPRRLVANCTIL